MQLIITLITTHISVLNARFLLVELEADGERQIERGGLNLRRPQGISGVMKTPSKFKYYC